MTNNERFEINLERIENGLPPLEGWDEWAKHQRPLSEEHSKELDKALGIIRDKQLAIAYVTELAEEAHANGNNWNLWTLPRLEHILNIIERGSV